ncbi:hypothetical protein [Kitasatospora sp. NPDC057015]|uniref:hypothetical protein n=1 Tax=Kitasatospora sp. NPDC057015 TaxID=3346001 RepID=UPI0036380462
MTPTTPGSPAAPSGPAVLDLELCGGRWDGHRKRVHAFAPPPSLRMALRADLPAADRGEYWPTTSVYRLEGAGGLPYYRHCHDE